MGETKSTFDSQNVQYNTRRRIAYHTGLFSAFILLSLGILVLVMTNVRHPFSWLVGLGTACLLPIAYLGYRIYCLSQIVWYIKVTDEYVEGYDYARRKIRLPWPEIKRVEIGDHELIITHDDGRFITLPADFSEFHTVGNLLFAQSRSRNIPVYINGRPWDSLSVYTLFPFLEDDEPATF